DNTLKIDRGTGYDNQRAVNVVGARVNVGTQVVQQFRIQCYNCKEYGHVARECQKPKRAKDAAYHREKMLLSHYMYMAQIQEVSPDVAENFGPVFDEPLQKVQNDVDNYNVFAKDRQHPEQPESINDTYSMDMSPNGGEVDHDDDDLARERDLLASLI
ncbi:gag-pol polyprotein, partial [Tanacetum coccineum]